MATHSGLGFPGSHNIRIDPKQKATLEGLLVLSGFREFQELQLRRSMAPRISFVTQVLPPRLIVLPPTGHHANRSKTHVSSGLHKGFFYNRA
jgi:hypothetical protein